MKTYCLKDLVSGQVFKILLSEEEFIEYLNENLEIIECINCIECEDAPSITLE
jgi:hypothetical protein